MLSVFALFHLNLAFSSIEEEDRGRVIDRCYWPLLRLADRLGAPLALEATVFTLDEIAARDPAWIAELRRLMALGRVEFVGSGQGQVIGPLVPASVLEANLGLGQAGYRRHLGGTPELALVNEQAVSAGLVEPYAAAGFEAILTDFDGTACHHPEWSRALRYLPQRAQGTEGSIELVWLSALAFQRVQRFVHGECDLADLLDFVARHKGTTPRALALYGNDAEVFDYRPGRFTTEAKLAGRSEWDRLEEAFRAILALPDVRFVRPSDVRGLRTEPGAGQVLTLGTPACPVPVKKQHKYNITRWAVTGRDDLALNSACWRHLRTLEADPQRRDWRTAPEAWTRLLAFWASDARTHITERRWRRLRAAIAEEVAPPAPALAAPHLQRLHLAPEADGRFLTLQTDAARVRLNLRRGLAIDRLWLDPAQNAAPVGTLAHGYYEDIGLAADWYTGTVVYDMPLRPKLTDLVPVTPSLFRDGATGALEVSARIDTPLGPIDKVLRLEADRPELKCRLTMNWEEWPHGSLRLGNITLVPHAFDPETLFYRTHLGGRAPETFLLKDETVEHGAPVSFLVSATTGLGMTDGTVELGDAQTIVRVTTDMAVSALLGLITHRPVDGTFFCRLALSAMELDETRRAEETHHGPRDFAFAISA
ncbi:MAG: glycoside hydrolase family 57 [Alphaproteobacteria bacterium]|nr:glycoside hydrolase family 57 [Alphaproteobacteria bacterium]